MNMQPMSNEQHGIIGLHRRRELSEAENADLEIPLISSISSSIASAVNPFAINACGGSVYIHSGDGESMQMHFSL